ncbi:MAG: hypothetical protein GF330_05040 [Candidatus Eisenbacteria bacterium]|nr:hypothetical protein [Candidatus Eisenbacteria bacterium]
MTTYTVLRAESAAGPWEEVGEVPAGTTDYVDRARVEGGQVAHEVTNGTPYYYAVRASGPDGGRQAVADAPAIASAQWYHKGKTPILTVLLVFSALVLYFVRKARKHPEGIYVRPIAGMDAVDEAVGRATEMGRPILYVLGLGTAATISTIASYAILARVAKKVAQYQSRLIIPNYDPIVMAVAQETVRQAYTDAGRPDLYDEKDIFFVTHAQFAYVAAVNGIMLREKTATNFYLGKFYAESLILAETGNIAGSIQIAGTDEASQLPFFVTACDYTLIGEELYAASAYLAREPLLLGALKAQDVLKGLAMAWLLVGALLTSFGVNLLRRWISVQM